MKHVADFLDALVRAIGWLGLIFSAGLLLAPQGLYGFILYFPSLYFKNWRPYVKRQWLQYDKSIATLLGANNPNLTISSEIGYRAHQGMLVAIILELVVNSLFYLLTGRPGHCADAIVWEEYTQE